MAPRMVGRLICSAELIAAVEKLRQEYPRWGRDEIMIRLRGGGFARSVSTVGRILKKLRERGALKEPLPSQISASKSRGNALTQ